MPVSKVGAATTYTLTNEDGSAVTPQEFYDAFMSGPVILELTVDTVHEDSHVASILWAGASPTQVTGVQILANGVQSGTVRITLGDMSGGA